MKKGLLLLLTTIAFFVARSQQQTILLFTEDFDNGTSSIIFDSAGPAGNNFGNNDWIINNAYNGQNIYPNTPSEDSTDGGLIINNAPYSTYLHIQDKASAALNDNWNPVNGSDRFCYIGNSFCTLGISDVQFTFDWICQGNSDAYGQVYFRIGTGPWTQTGLPKYFGEGKWKYESIEDPRLVNQQNVQIGFRWVNPGSGGPYDVAFGLDDIFAVGNYNPADTTGNITISTQLLQNVICQGDPVTLALTLSSSLCDGNYEIELSNKYGQFDDPYNIGTFEAGPEFVQASYQSEATDDNLIGNCFKVRIVRTGPPPYIISDTTLCLTIMACPNSIFNVLVPVFTDADTACILSELDVMFNSTGVFRSNNVYYAELSDSAGNFNDPTQLGQLPSLDSFPSIPPGDISGLVPASVVPGCNYYVRVRSTNPVTISDTIGPICLKHCDVLTNNMTDISLCAGPSPYPYANCDTINIDAHYWNNHEQYSTCNNWVVELRKTSDFSLVNYGGLAVYHDTVSGNFILCVPTDITQLPVAPGEYYMRISSTCPSPNTDSTGTVIRITIGAPQPSAPSLIVLGPDSVCPSEETEIFVDPYNSPPSQYQWSGTLFSDIPTIVPAPGIGIEFPAGTPPGTFTANVQEINYGCYGPGSANVAITLLPGPTPAITGPTTVCVGDSGQYNITFLGLTYYTNVWQANPLTGLTILDVSNVQTTVGFDSIGTYTITNFSINVCGSANDSLIVTVTPPYLKLNSGPDTTLCYGDSITVSANSSPLNIPFEVQDSGTNVVQGGMFNLVAHTNLTIDSFGLFLSSWPTSFEAEVYGKQGSYLGFEQNPSAWQLLGKNLANGALPQGEFSPIDAEIGHTMVPGDTFAFYVTTLGTPLITSQYGIGNGPQGSLYSTDGDLDFMQGTVLNYSFTDNLTGPGYVLNVTVYYSTTTGLTYTWSNGNSNASFSIAPSSNISYSLLVSNQGHCAVRDTVNIKVVPSPTVNAGPDATVCPNQPYQMQGTSPSANVNFLWLPSTGLSSATDPTATFNYTDSVTFVLVATDTLNSCKAKDTVSILVPLKLKIATPDTSICQGELDTIQVSSTGNFFAWSPGFALSDSAILNPVFNSTLASQGTTYTYTITVSDNNNCKLSGEVEIEVDNCTGKIVAPSAFTPTYAGNGTGAADDHFIVWGKNIKEYEVRIYNRWGELVYDSGMLGSLEENYSPPLWDGKYKGKLQDTGTFVYYITATTEIGKNLSTKGNVTLIR